MNEATNWGPGLVALALAAGIAIVFLVLSRRGKTGEVHPGTVDDLTVRYERLLGELKEHTANKHLMAAADWETEKVRLEQAAAQILRERQGVKHEAAKAEGRAEKKVEAAVKDASFLAQNPAFKGLFIAIAVVGFFIFLGVQLSDSTKPREDGPATGGPMGGMGMGRGPQGQPQQPEVDPELRLRIEAAQRNPDNVDALTEAGMYLVSRQDFDGARPFFLRAATIDPYDVRARIGRGVMLAVDGEAKLALDELEHLAVTYPEAWEARFYAGLIAREEKDPERALKQLEAFLVQAPASEQPPVVTQLIAELKPQVAKPPPAPPMPGPAPKP